MDSDLQATVTCTSFDEWLSRWSNVSGKARKIAIDEATQAIDDLERIVGQYIRKK